VTAAAIVGVAGLLAVTPLVAGGAAHLSAGLVAMPGYVHASVPGTEAMRPFAPRAEYEAPARAGSVLAERGDRVFKVAAPENRTAARPAAPDFADFDRQRLSGQHEADGPMPAVGRYAWVSGDAVPVTLASLDRRFAESTSLAVPDTVLSEIAAAEVVEDDELSVPLPVTRPRIDIASVPADDTPASAAVASVAPQPERDPAQPAAERQRPAGAALAYANPDVQVEEEKSGGIFGRLFGRRDMSLLPGRGSKVAVYDIGAAVVYMPNGEKLEAHSGFGKMKDDPRYVAEKNKGPTPPNLYKLRMREARFHGVEAIRLLPADGKKKFNRDGLLAHTYMYVRGGGMDKAQSNGCVAFKDYDRFLSAFKRGEIEHLIVVPHLKEVPTYMAAL